MILWQCTPNANFFRMQTCFTAPKLIILALMYPVRWNHASLLKKKLSNAAAPCHWWEMKFENHLQKQSCFCGSSDFNSCTRVAPYPHNFNHFKATNAVEWRIPCCKATFLNDVFRDSSIVPWCLIIFPKLILSSLWPFSLVEDCNYLKNYPWYIWLYFS